jgi:hypothetical protein
MVIIHKFSFRRLDKTIQILFKVCDLIILPLAGLMLLSIVAIIAFLGFQSPTAPLLKWPTLVLTVVVIPYLTLPFFVPLKKYILERKKNKRVG